MNALEDETTTVSHVTIVDREAWASDLSVELLVTRGVLGLASSTSLQVTTAVAEPEGHRVSIVGRLDRINALLQTLTYTSCKDCAGSATLNISVTDEAGQTGSGAIDFSIAPINDPPRFVAEWDAPSRLVMDEDGAALLLPTVKTQDVDDESTLVRMLVEPPSTGQLRGQGHTATVLEMRSNRSTAGTLPDVRFLPAEDFSGNVTVL